jgi:CheY-like chemotaxis protein
VVRVRDTGDGIPRDQLQRVFDLFAQTHREMDRSQGGLGIGLTVVRSLAALHGGSATIDSDGPGRGAEATITLPLVTVEARTSDPPIDADTQTVRPLRIVIIEDNPDAADALAVYLQRLGHDVAIARDGRAGLEAVARHRPEVVICDIGLPEVDGYEVARRLLAGEDGHPCLLIAVTGYGDVVDRARTRAAGFAHHLTKPADPAELVRLLADAERVRCA